MGRPSADLTIGKPSAALIQSQVQRNMTFGRTLMAYVRKRCNGNASVCYKHAGISRQVYSKIISSPETRASKRTVMQLCIGLRLSYQEAVDFMAAAGYGFAKSSYEDMTFAWCLENGVYSIFDVNELLVCGHCEPAVVY